jgi:integrase
MKSRKTRYPGVKMIGERKAEIRFQITDPKTGQVREVERIISDVASPAEASVRRTEMRESILSEAKTERIRLSAFAESWLNGKLSELKASTAERYATTLDLHILPKFGKYYLDAITHQDVKNWRDAQDAAPGTINTRLRLFKTLLADATHEYELPRNPAARVPAVRDVKLDDDEAPNALTAEELAILLEGVREHRPKYYPLVATLAFTGARISEATSLRWEDIVEPVRTERGVTPGYIKIRRGHHRGTIDTTKTGTKRTAPLAEELYRILCAHHRNLGTWTFRFDLRDKKVAKLSTDELAALQATAVEAGWVFPNPEGGPMYTTVLRKPFNQALDYLAKKGDEVQRITIHGLRRTLNNLLRQETLDKVVVRSVIGHVTEKMTEHYSHVPVSEKASALAQVISIVRRSPSTAANADGVVVETTRQKPGAKPGFGEGRAYG